MSPVIKNRIKAAKRWKRLDVGSRVTDRTDGMLVAGGELLGVTRCARNMSGHLRRSTTFAPDMTNETRQTAVLLRVVREARKILRRRFNQHGISRLVRDNREFARIS